MVNATSIILTAIKSDLAAVDRIGQNVANVNTPGYQALSTQKIDREAFLVLVEGSSNISSTDLLSSEKKSAAGPLIHTGKTTDVAAMDGYSLQVRGAKGEIMVRSAHLSISAGGFVVNNYGQQLLDDSGSPIRGVNSINLSQNATLSTDGGKLIHFKVTNKKGQPVEEAGSRVLSVGYLRGSNVQSSKQMVQLMEISKHLESTQRAFRTLDELHGTGINQLGK